MNIHVARGVAFCVAFLVPAALSRAHPGHDGHELTWDFSHLAAHPAATSLWIALGLLAGGAGWLLMRPYNEPSRDWPLWIATAVTVVLVWRTKIHLLWLLGAGALLGILGIA